MEKLSAILPELEIEKRNSAEQIERLEAKYRQLLPDDFRDYLHQCGGAEGVIGETGYIALWGIDEIEERNQYFNEAEMFKGLLLFASDGGGEAYAIDFRGDGLTYVEIPYIGDEVEDAIVLGKTIWEMFRELKRQSLE